MLKRRVKDAAKRAYLGLFRLGERMGFHVVPVHYGSPIPSLRWLRESRAIWARRSSLAGIRVDLDEQARLLAEVCGSFAAEVQGNPVYKDAVAQGFGPGYGYIEAQVLHCFVRRFKPARIIEVGSGVSSACMLHAARMNDKESGGGKRTSITCIEPSPSEALRRLEGIELISEIVQKTLPATFDRLAAGDLLFIDSSHVVKPAGDVNYLYLEVLPRLKPGVLIHIHDICFPFDYDPSILNDFFHKTEISMLQAYLAHNSRVEILFCLSHLHHDRPKAIKAVLPDYDPLEIGPDGLYPEDVKAFSQKAKHYPSSIYLRTK